MRTERKKLPKKVRQYKTEAAKVRRLVDKALELMKDPEVRAHVEAQTATAEAAQQPTPEEKKQKELSYLYDRFFNVWDHIEKYVMILSELSHAKDSGLFEISLQDIHGMVSEIDDNLWKVFKHAARTFALVGIIKEDTEGLEEIEDLLPVKPAETSAA